MSQLGTEEGKGGVSRAVVLARAAIPLLPSPVRGCNGDLSPSPVQLGKTDIQTFKALVLKSKQALVL